MRKRYPHTLSILALIACMLTYVGLVVLWHPFVWISLVAAVIFMLVASIRIDRERNQR